MKNQCVLIIAFIVLIAGISIPASAYTLLQENTTGYGSGGNNLGAGLHVVNFENFDNVTHIVVTGKGCANAGIHSDTTSWSMCSDGNYNTNCGTNYGDAVMSVVYTHNSLGCGGNLDNETFVATIDISNLNRYGQTGTKDIYFKNASKMMFLYFANDMQFYSDVISGSNPGGPYGAWLFGGAGAGHYYIYGGTSVSAPVASFTCTPTSQYPDVDIVCTDSSTNTPTSWLWSIDMEGAGIKGWQTHTGQNFTWQSHYPGLYSVNLNANNSAGNDWENKTNYVSISMNATPNNCNLPVATGYIRTYAQTNDGMTSGGIYGSQIQMRDMEGGAWSNTTSSEGYWCIDTLPGHSLNLYAQATGYTSTSQLGVSANGGRYYLVLWPDYIPAPSAGNVSLYVLVYDQQTGSPLYLSTVRVDGNNINTFLKNTGPEGQAIFTIKNNTVIHVTASKAGYDTITRTMTTSNSGPDTLMISLPRSTITPTVTATTGPGGTIPVTQGPYGTPGPMGTMAPGYTNNQGQMMLDYLAAHGMDLIQLCFLVTVCALLGIKFGK
jgi:PKD repeat protein